MQLLQLTYLIDTSNKIASYPRTDLLSKLWIHADHEPLASGKP